jgi:hypothetical protein
MSSSTAERWVTISALLVAGVYIYRRLTEGSGQASGSKLAQLTGKGSPAPIGQFITAWGFAYLVISVIASASPGLGGSFAILVAAGDLLGNAQQVSKDVNAKLGVPSGTAPAAGANASPPAATSFSAGSTSAAGPGFK